MDSNGHTNGGEAPASSGDPVQGYDVGYGKPPKASQFQKGRSGNPAGAKAHKKYNLQTAVDEVLNAQSLLTINGRARKSSALEVFILQQMKLALTGDVAAIRRIVKLAKKTSRFSDLKQIVGVYEHPEPRGQMDFDILRYRELKAVGVDLSGELDLSLFPEVEEDS